MFGSVLVFETLSDLGAKTCLVGSFGWFGTAVSVAVVGLKKLSMLSSWMW